MFTVYVLFSPSHDKIYIGYTSDLEARLYAHNNSQKGWTVRYRPWTVIHHETFHTKSEAMKREKQLKSAQGRQFIRSLGSYPPVGGHKFSRSIGIVPATSQTNTKVLHHLG